MTSDSSRDPVDRQQLQAMQIVVGGLVCGCVTFLLVAILVGQTVGALAADVRPLMTYLAVGFAAVGLIARMVIPDTVVARGRRRIAASQTRELEETRVRGALLPLFSVRTLLAAAIAEGVTFFMLTAYLLEQSRLALILAVVLIAGVATHMPTRRGVVHWIDQQLKLIEQERQLGR